MSRIATNAVLVALLTSASVCTGPNPHSCIPTPGMCGAGKSCDMSTGDCVTSDAGRGSDAADAVEGSDSATGDVSSDADRPADDGGSDSVGDVVDAPRDTGASNGMACSKAMDCASGHCADGVCCDTTCTGACTSCALPATKGICSAVKNADDPDSCPVAMNKTCDAKGACTLKNGETCGKAADCVSGNCADGVCCNTPCKDACSSCALGASKGTCSPVKNGDDPDSCAAATRTCDASGACKLKNAAACGGGADCASGNCADGVCCNTGCTGSCLSCAVTGSAGTCSAIKGADDLDTCSGAYTCSPAAACRLKDAQPCTTNDNCASSICGRFYRDADGDGYGDMAISATYCTSPPSASPPWVVRGDDCCDKDGKVHPGQTEYQLYASAACGDTYDYDCNGTEDREYSSTYSCATAGDGTCDPISHDGWSGVIPACGKWGNLAHCGQSTCGPISCCIVTSTDMDYPARCR